MLKRNGLSAKRAKHEIISATKPMIVTKLIVNSKPSLSQKKRSQVRAQVRQLELAAQSSGNDPDAVRVLVKKAAQRVGQLGRFHKIQASHLKDRVKNVRVALPPESFSEVTYPNGRVSTSVPMISDHERAPWE